MTVNDSLTLNPSSTPTSGGRSLAGARQKQMEDNRPRPGRVPAGVLAALLAVQPHSVGEKVVCWKDVLVGLLQSRFILCGFVRCPPSTIATELGVGAG